MNEPVDEFEFFLEKIWSDGFPVVTPTEERIARILGDFGPAGPRPPEDSNRQAAQAD